MKMITCMALVLLIAFNPETRAESATDPESFVRQFFRYMMEYNYDEMEAMVAPGFKAVLERNARDNWKDFETALRQEESFLGPLESRPGRFSYKLSDFNIDETPEVAYVSFLTTNLEGHVVRGRLLPQSKGSYMNMFVLNRFGSKWKLRFLGSVIPMMPGGYEQFLPEDERDNPQ